MKQREWKRLAVQFAALAVLLLATVATSGARPAAKNDELKIYFVDVEGGQATLFVTPDKHSLLIDTGWSGANGRDADRIAAAAKDAGVAKLDFVLLTHYHIDHTGGFPELAEKMPIGMVFDHGPNHQPGDPATEQAFQAYRKAAADKKIERTTPHVGDVLPIPGMRVEVISSDGKTITKALPGAGQDNPACAGAGPFPEDTSENPYSLGTLITFGKLRVLDLGDLTSDKEVLFMCPKNLLGRVDVLVVSHHGTKTSSSKAFVHGVAPRVAIMDNGATKGGSVEVLDTVRSSPGLEDLWQLHFSNIGGPEHNVKDPARIANPAGPDAAYYLKLTGWKDGSFAVFNARTGETKKYAAK